MESFTVRQARAFLEVADQGSVTGAAAALNKSQTSVTKTIQKFEYSIDLKLFERSSRGVKLSVYGEVLLPKAIAAREEFEKAQALVPLVILSESRSAARFFKMDVSDKWLDAFVATVDAHSVAAAASHLGITSAAVSASLRKLEDSLGISLFERAALPLEPTVFSRSAVRHIKLARNLLRQGIEEMASVKGIVRGRVVIGTLPFVRSTILPKAIIKVLNTHPELDVVTTESPYDDLITGLRCGDVDFVVGALRGSSAAADILEDALLDDDLSIMCRTGHPLLAKEKVSWADLLNFPWVLPRHGTPTRELVHQLIVSNGLNEPEHVVETSSFIILRGLVMDSDRVTVLSRHQCLREIDANMMSPLNILLPGTERSIGIAVRSNSKLAPAAQLLVDEIKNTVAY